MSIFTPPLEKGWIPKTLTRVRLESPVRDWLHSQPPDYQVQAVAKLVESFEVPMSEKEAWEWMGLHDDTSWKQVQSRYHTFVDIYHPTSIDGQEWAPMHKINEAMAVLQRVHDGHHRG